MLISRAAAVRQAKAAANRLLSEGVGGGGAQRNDGVEVGDVPALFEHVHVDDDFNFVVRSLEGEQKLNVLVLLGALLCGVNLYAFIAADSPCSCAPNVELWKFLMSDLGTLPTI